MTVSMHWRDRLTQVQAKVQAQAQRIDALGLRERMFLFLAAAAVIAALLDSLLITPLNTERNAALRVQRQQSEELLGLRQQFGVASLRARAAGGSAQLTQRIEQAQQEYRRLDEDIKASSAMLAGPSQAELSALLAELLRRQPGLNLVKLSTLVEGPKATRPPALDGWQWQGVELHVAGNYLDLMRYLQQLEKSLPGLHWGELRVTAAAAGQPALLQVQLFLLRARS